MDTDNILISKWGTHNKGKDHMLALTNLRSITC